MYMCVCVCVHIDLHIHIHMHMHIHIHVLMQSIMWHNFYCIGKIIVHAYRRTLVSYSFISCLFYSRRPLQEDRSVPLPLLLPAEKTFLVRSLMAKTPAGTSVTLQIYHNLRAKLNTHLVNSPLHLLLQTPQLHNDKMLVCSVLRLGLAGTMEIKIVQW